MSVELGWAVIEMLGHRVIAGFVSEVEIAGAGFLRVDLWAEEGTPGATQFVAPGSVYAITPSTEEAVRERMKPRPVRRLALEGPGEEWFDSCTLCGEDAAVCDCPEEVER